MSGRNRLSLETLVLAIATIGLALVSAETGAQVVDATSSYGAASEPNPYYIGVSQALTHDSNVYRIQDGPADYYSSTSLFGGFDQLISRQRVYARASASLNRYHEQDPLNNTSYNFAGGLDWETIEHLSGNLYAAYNHGLAAPVAAVGVPVQQTKNLTDLFNVNARARWGGPSLFTIEGYLDYSSTNYSEPIYVTSESSTGTASLGGYYHSGGPVRVGLAGRVTRTHTPKAFIDPTTNQYVSTDLDGRNVDLLLDYDLSGQLVGNARLSYTRQSNSGPGSADFSGFTGGVAMNWTITGKTSLRFDAAHDTGFNAQAYNTFVFTPTSTGIALTPIVGVYNNNSLTDSAGLGVNYSATAKITATGNARYLRARTKTGSVAGPLPDIVDISKILSIGANYAITRAWGAGCSAGYEKRDVSGGQNFSYDAKTVGCSTQFVWR
jgi:Putative beta-barrel porin 2